MVKSSTSLVLSIAYYLVGSSFQSPPASAQITPDGTTSTSVNVDGNNFEINNYATKPFYSLNYSSKNLSLMRSPSLDIAIAK